jgi:hypothetical protein
VRVEPALGRLVQAVELDDRVGLVAEVEEVGEEGELLELLVAPDPVVVDADLATLEPRIPAEGLDERCGAELPEHLGDRAAEHVDVVDGLRLGRPVVLEIGDDLVARVEQRPARIGVDRRAVRELPLTLLVLAAAADQRAPRELFLAGILDARARDHRVPRLPADAVADARGRLDARGGDEEDDPGLREAAEEA